MSKAKKIAAFIKLAIPAGKANPSPPVGPALGQRGLNIMEFCKAFNEKTSHIEPNTPTPVVITAYADKSFTFIIKTAPVAYLLKKAANAAKGSGAVGKADSVGSVTMEQVKEIAKIKMVDLNTDSIESACSMIIGSAKSMGIEVKS